MEYTSIQHAIASIFSSLPRQASETDRDLVVKFASETQEIMPRVLPLVSAGVAADYLVPDARSALRNKIRGETGTELPDCWLDVAIGLSFSILSTLRHPRG